MDTFTRLTVCVVCAACGAVFGIAVEKGRVSDPLSVQEQMLFKKNIMLKMMLSALLTGMFFLALLSMIPFTRNKFLIVTSNFTGCLKQKSYQQVALGAAMLGVGMHVSGACPGIVLAQVGSGVTNAGYTFLGALFGALLYGLMEPQISRMMKPSEPVKTQLLHQEWGTPYFMLAFPITSALAILVFGVELFVPWRSEVSTQVCGNTGQENLFTGCWPPYMAGALIGCLQIPIAFAVSDTLGSSSSYCTMVSQFLRVGPLRNLSPYLTSYQSGVDNWWQVLYVAGAIIGAYFSSTISGTYGVATGVSPLAGFCGGILLVYGARLAGGCTSGHGISGTGLLNMMSLTATAAMFAGGIGTAVLRLALGV